MTDAVDAGRPRDGRRGLPGRGAGAGGHPDLQRGRQRADHRRPGPRRRSPTSTCSSPTTAAPTAPAPSPTSWPRPTAQVHVLHRTAKEGLGAAYVAGFAVGPRPRLRRGRRDGRRRLARSRSSCRRSSTRCADADAVLGSRYVPGGKVVNWPVSRQLISRDRQPVRADGRSACPSRTPPAATAPTACRCSTRSRSTRSRRRATASRSTWPWRAHKSGCRLVEVPITFAERERGQSKMSSTIVREALWRVTVWGAQARARRRSPAVPQACLSWAVMLRRWLATLGMLARRRRARRAGGARPRRVAARRRLDDRAADRQVRGRLRCWCAAPGGAAGGSSAPPSTPGGRPAARAPTRRSSFGGGDAGAAGRVRRRRRSGWCCWSRRCGGRRRGWPSGSSNGS